MQKLGVTNLTNFLEKELQEEFKTETRKNRFMDEKLSNQKRSLTQSLSQVQKRKYDFVATQNIKRER